MRVLREWELGKVPGELARWLVGPAAAPQRATSPGRAAATGPRVGRAAGEEPPGAGAGRGAGPCPRPPRLRSLPSWGSSGRLERLGTSRPGTSSSPRPADPPAARLGPPAGAPGAPRGHRLREEQPRLWVPTSAPHPATPRTPRAFPPKLPPNHRTAPSPPAGVYRDSGRRRLFGPSTKMAAGPEPRLQRLERVCIQCAGASPQEQSGLQVPAGLARQPAISFSPPGEADPALFSTSPRLYLYSSFFFLPFSFLFPPFFSEHFSPTPAPR